MSANVLGAQQLATVVVALVSLWCYHWHECGRVLSLNSNALSGTLPDALSRLSNFMGCAAMAMWMPHTARVMQITVPVRVWCLLSSTSGLLTCRGMR